MHPVIALLACLVAIWYEIKALRLIGTLKAIGVLFKMIGFTIWMMIKALFKI